MDLILSLIRRLLETVKKLVGASSLPVLAVGSGLLGAGLWLAEHDARVRQSAELHDLQQQTRASISTLQAQAAADVREANQQRAQAVDDLEGRERRLQQDAARLRDQIAALESRKNAELEQVAALPASELTSRAAVRLGLTPQELPPRHGPVEPGAVELPVGDQLSPGAPPAEPVDPKLGSSGGALSHNRASSLANPDGSGDPASPAAARAGSKPGAAADGEEWAPAAGSESRHSPLEIRSGGDPSSPPPAGEDTGATAPVGGLSEAGWRKLDAALVEGDACRRESTVLNQEIANLNEQVTTQGSMLGEQSVSIEKLNQALVAKDEVLKQSEAEHRAELRVARGTFLGRLGRVAKYVALGVVVGVVIR